MSLNPTSFHEDGDEVVVHGSIRVARPTGGFSEAQISWIYRFRDRAAGGAGWSPRQSTRASADPYFLRADGHDVAAVELTSAATLRLAVDRDLVLDQKRLASAPEPASPDSSSSWPRRIVSPRISISSIPVSLRHADQRTQSDQRDGHQHHAREVIANVELDAGGQRIVASITTEAAAELELAEGKEVTATSRPPT